MPVQCRLARKPPLASPALLNALVPVIDCDVVPACHVSTDRVKTSQDAHLKSAKESKGARAQWGWSRMLNLAGLRLLNGQGYRAEGSSMAVLLPGASVQGSHLDVLLSGRIWMGGWEVLLR